MSATEHAVHTLEFIRGNEFAIPTYRVLKQDGTLYQGAVLPDLEQEQALRIYRAMVRTRALDERMLAAQRQGRVSFYRQWTGEEASTVGLAAALMMRI